MRTAVPFGPQQCSPLRGAPGRQTAESLQGLGDTRPFHPGEEGAMKEGLDALVWGAGCLGSHPPSFQSLCSHSLSFPTCKTESILELGKPWSKPRATGVSTRGSW